MSTECQSRLFILGQAK